MEEKREDWCPALLRPTNNRARPVRSIPRALEDFIGFLSLICYLVAAKRGWLN